MLVAWFERPLNLSRVDRVRFDPTRVYAGYSYTLGRSFHDDSKVAVLRVGHAVVVYDGHDCLTQDCHMPFRKQQETKLYKMDSSELQ
jgi:hypothetical protein